MVILLHVIGAHEGSSVKKGSGLLMLLLAGLLVALPAAAAPLEVANGSLDLDTYATKINTKEEVVSDFQAGENVAALAVAPGPVAVAAPPMLAFLAVIPGISTMRDRDGKGKKRGDRINSGYT
jgi:hypothetical protein